MKRFLAVLCALVLALSLTVSALAEAADTVASASVMDYYGDFAITGDDLMNALNSYSGTYLISTVNADGTPHCGYFIYGCVKHDDKYYLQFGLAENQTRENLIATGKCVAVYAANPDLEAEDAKPYAMSGARMWGELVTDEALLAELNTTGSDTVLFFEIVAVRSLG